MNQLQCTGQGGPFKVVQAPTPTIESGEVLIRQKIISLNPLDWKQRDFGIMIPKWPHILGVEGAGVVEAVGPGVSDLQPGDEVAANVQGVNRELHGAYQDCIAVPRANVFKRPKDMSLQDAAALPICYTAAVCAIYGGLKIPLPFIPETARTGSSPKSVLILGGASSVGAAAIQLLRIAYPSLPILATCSEKHKQHLSSLGATDTFEYNSPTLVNDIRHASPNGQGVDMILDAVGSGAQQKDIFDAFAADSTKAYSALLTGPMFAVPAGVAKVDINATSFSGLQGGHKVLPVLTELIESGKFKPPFPVRVVGKGLEQIPDAMDLTKAVSGEKLVVCL